MSLTIFGIVLAAAALHALWNAVVKGASDTLKESFFKNMSGRAAKLLQDDMAGMGPVRVKDVDDAQTRMVATAKDLAAKGEIIILKTKSDDQMIA